MALGIDLQIVLLVKPGDRIDIRWGLIDVDRLCKIEFASAGYVGKTRCGPAQQDDIRTIHNTGIPSRCIKRVPYEIGEAIAVGILLRKTRRRGRFGRIDHVERIEIRIADEIQP